MYIYGTSSLHSAQGINAPHRPTSTPTRASAPSFGTDHVDLSPQAEFMGQVRDLPDIRADRVAELRAQIASGKYETEEKISVALDRLLDEMG